MALAPGALYYRLLSNAWHLWDGKRHFRLGVTEAEAYRTRAECVSYVAKLHTIGALHGAGAGKDRRRAPLHRARPARKVRERRRVFGACKGTHDAAVSGDYEAGLQAPRRARSARPIGG